MQEHYTTRNSRQNFRTLALSLLAQKRGGSIRVRNMDWIRRKECYASTNVTMILDVLRTLHTRLSELLDESTRVGDDISSFEN